ncbi:MAG: sensor histidine kinase [Thermoguttaceae bacterium]|jgi:signal transduction histidine kinase
MVTDHRDTEIAELKEKITRLEKALEEVQSLSAIGELAGTTAHEFNNILTLTLNYARMGQRHQDDATRNEMFAKIIDASNRAAKIVKVVLGLARNRKPGKESTDLRELIDAVLLLLEREMTKYRIRIDKTFKDVPNVLANGNQIQQVLINLLVNARQASPSGGVVLVKLQPCKKMPNFVEIVVRDRGSGIPKDRLPYIFDTFYSSKKGPDASGKGGSGLGLAMCKRIIEDHSGKICVKSSVGKGTLFAIRLPVFSAKDN